MNDKVENMMINKIKLNEQEEEKEITNVRRGRSNGGK